MRLKTVLPFFILACVVVVVFFLGSKGQLLYQKLRGKKEYLFPKIPIEKVDYLEINKRGEKKIFLKQDGEWQEKEATTSAKQENIKNALEAIQNLKREQLVSDNPSKREVFLVDSSGTQVILKAGEKVLAHFYIGKRGQDFLSNFYRKEGEDKVYLSPQILDSIFDPHQLKE